MKNLLNVSFLAIITLFVLSCNDSGSSTSSANAELTTNQVNQISTALVGAMNSSGAGSTKTSSINVEDIDSNATVNIDGFTYNQVCSPTDNKFTATANGTYNCAGSGHITYNGNFLLSCSAGGYYYPANNGIPAYCTCSTFYTANSITFQVSDPTNNLNDCDTGNGIILDGTVYVNATGTGTAINVSMTGTIGINQRGSSGGLTPIANDCSIYIYYSSSTGKITGTICGNVVSN